MEHQYKSDFELAICETCGLYEGGLTTDCSGKSSSHKSDMTYGGKLDYRKEEGWVNKLNPTNQSWMKGQIFSFLKGKSKYEHENEIILAFGTSKEEYEKVKGETLRYLYNDKTN